MLYAKIKNNLLVQYPYGFTELKTDNPSTNFSGVDLYSAFQGTEENIAGNMLVLVVTQGQPAYDTKTQKVLLSSTPVLIAGEWLLEHSVVDKNTAELEQQEIAKSSSVRTQRGEKLKETDWTQVADAPVDQAAWAAYRQALRDMTSQPGFPYEVQWPIQPE